MFINKKYGLILALGVFAVDADSSRVTFAGAADTTKGKTTEGIDTAEDNTPLALLTLNNFFCQGSQVGINNFITTVGADKAQTEELQAIAKDIDTSLDGKSLRYIVGFLKGKLSNESRFQGKETEFNAFAEIFNNLEKGKPMFIPRLSLFNTQPTYLDIENPNDTLQGHIDYLDGVLGSFLPDFYQTGQMCTVRAATKQADPDEQNNTFVSIVKTYLTAKALKTISFQSEDLLLYNAEFAQISAARDQIPGTASSYQMAIEALNDVFTATRSLEFQDNSNTFIYSPSIIETFEKNKNEVRQMDIRCLQNIISQVEQIKDSNAAKNIQKVLISLSEAFKTYEIEEYEEALEEIEAKITELEAQEAAAQAEAKKVAEAEANQDTDKGSIEVVTL